MKLKKLLSSLLSTNAAFVILLLLQIFFLLFIVTRLGERFVLVYFLLIVLDIVLLVYITNKNEPISYRMAWIVAISIFPLFGGVSYLYLKLSQQFPKSLDMRNQKQSKELLVQDKAVMDELSHYCPDSLNLARYISDYGLYPVYR
ncbi:MAG: PLD nuclease N-terminal domain-containing protein, partial [Ruminococcus sp.]|uniref:PLD nuclease N-terminal domain-containing protein n=1 Tax=Ruminococcus sp. TaxID=41978 RepID=UPI0025EBFE1F